MSTSTPAKFEVLADARCKISNRRQRLTGSSCCPRSYRNHERWVRVRQLTAPCHAVGIRRSAPPFLTEFRLGRGICSLSTVFASRNAEMWLAFCLRYSRRAPIAGALRLGSMSPTPLWGNRPLLTASRCAHSHPGCPLEPTEFEHALQKLQASPGIGYAIDMARPFRRRAKFNTYA